MRLLVLSLTLAILSGCVSNFVEPAADAPSAQLITKEADLSATFGAPKGQFFDAFTDENCSKADGTGRITAYGRYNAGGDKTFRIPTGKRFFIRATFVEHTGSATTIYSNYCTNLVSFIPEVGHKYLVYQTPRQQNCSMSLADAESGGTPATFHSEPVSLGCHFVQK